MKTYRKLLRNHTPHDKSPYEVTDSSCEVEIQDYDGSAAYTDAWTQITLTERYTNVGGRRNLTRSVSVVLNKDQRADLLKLLFTPNTQ